MAGLKILKKFLKNLITYAKISPEMVNPRAIAGNAEEEEDEDSESGQIRKISRKNGEAQRYSWERRRRRRKPAVKAQRETRSAKKLTSGVVCTQSSVESPA